MKRLIIYLIILFPLIAYSETPKTHCGFSDDVAMDFLGLAYLVASYYENFQTWPSAISDLEQLKIKIPDSEKAFEVIMTRFKNLKFEIVNSESNIQLSYLKGDGSEISGTLIIPPMGSIDQMIQNMRAEGGLKELANR